ncbi:MAG: tail fiber domain-containing protein [Bacteroidales bacterium]
MSTTLIRKAQLVNLGIVDADVAAGAAIVTTKLADGASFIKKEGTVAFTADQSMGNFKLTNLAAPISANDAARLIDIQNASAGISAKDAVRVATTANITLSGVQTIDGVSVIAGDRVLVKAQTTGGENGIYVAAAGAWTRSADANTALLMKSGSFVFVCEGTTNADSGWILSTDGAITLGTTTLTFVQFSGAGTITAGSGMTKTGSTLDVGTASATRIVVNADNIDLYAIATGAALGASGANIPNFTFDNWGRVTVASTGILINASSGADTGTGDVSLKVDETYLDSLYPRLSTSRAQNTFLAAPSSGAGSASFRAIVSGDVPTLNQNTTGTAATVTSAAQPNITSVGTLTTLNVSGSIYSTGVTTNGAYTGISFVGGTYTSSIYSDGSTLVIANDGMIYLQSVTGGVLYAKGQKVSSDTWFEMFANGTSRAKTTTAGFSVTGCGYFSNGIEVTGDVKATGDGYFFNSVSDMRFKTDFERMQPDYGIDIVRKTNPYWFTWVYGKKTGERDFGFGAQEIEKILPEMVQHRPDGTLGLYYDHYTAILASAVQHLDNRVTDLTNELKALRNG